MKSYSICNVPSNFNEMKSYSILIYFNDSDRVALKKVQKEMFPKKSILEKSYKTFYVNTNNLSEINRRLNWKLNTSGSYDSGTKILIKRDINFLQLGLLLYPEKTENLLNEFFIEKFEIPIHKERKLGIMGYLKNLIPNSKKIAE